MYQILEIQRDGEMVIRWMNRPEIHNTFNPS
jgi:hypothetical protein